jgi:hypothetical protein
MQFDTKDLKVGQKFTMVVEVVEDRDFENEQFAVFMSAPDLTIQETLFKVNSLDKYSEINEIK